jgi:hypothetical protein
MTKQIIALLALLSIGTFSAVYAETATVEVPFESHGQSCNFDEIAVEYHCIWQGVVDPVTAQEIEELINSINDRIIDDQIAELNANALEEIANEPLTKDEKTIQKFELQLEHGVIKTPDAVLLQMLRTLDECQQGLDNSSAIQQERTFVISQYQHLGLHNVQVVGQLGELSMAIQECKAQQVLENQILTVAYKHFADADKAGNYDHYKAFEGVSAIPFDKFTSTSSQIDMSAICDNHQFSNQHKEQAGCVVLYDGKTMDQVKRENELRFGTDGVVGYQSEPLDKYFDFLTNYGNRIATEQDKQLQADIAEPIAEEMIEDNVFYQNKIKYGD